MIPTVVNGPVRPAPLEAQSEALPRASRWPSIVLVFSGAVAAVWTVTAVLTAGHGFDITDEGFYLLSYRWWDVHHRNFTGAAYLYGPVFALLDHHIGALRIFRLLTVVGTHLVFGWCFMRWLRLRRPAAAPTRIWEAAGAAAIVAAGGAVYGWLPQSPGYNDVVLLGALLGLALVLRAATFVDRGVPVPGPLFAGLGAVAVVVLLAKWAALPVVLLIAATALLVVAPQGIRAIARTGGWALAATAVATAAVHVFVVSLTTAVPELLAVNRLLAGQSMSMPVLLDRYWTTSMPMVEATARQYGLLLVAAAVAVCARRPAIRVAAWLLGAGGIGLAGWHAMHSGGLGGGAINVLKYIVPLLAAVAFALVVTLAAVVNARMGRPAARRSSLAHEKARGWLLIVVLVLLPVVQAIGTGNIPLKVAVDAFAVWMAVLIAVLTGLEGAPAVARCLTAAVAALALLATAAIATGGLWRHPYRGVPQGETTASVPGVPALDGIIVDPETARGYAALRQRLRPYVEPEGRAIMGFDKMAGVLLVLGGRSVGEVWYASNDRPRSAAGIVAECADGSPWWGSRSPILLFNRPVRKTDLQALQSCGLDFRTDYRLLAPPSETMDLQVFVPITGVGG